MPRLLGAASALTTSSPQNGQATLTRQFDWTPKRDHPAQPSQFEAIGNKVDKVAGPGESGDVDDDDEKVVQEIESLCMNCHDNGVTRLFLTAIPYFREIILMSFECEHCGFRNNEIQTASEIQVKGSYYELRLTDMADFSRQVVKADTATANNIEGLLRTVVDDLELAQDQRKEQDPENYEKIAAVIQKGRDMLEGKSFPFRITIDDPAGNSFIAPNLTDSVGKWEKHEFVRTPEQNAALGLSAGDGSAPAGASAQPGLTAEGDIIPDEVYSFPATCPGCTHNCTTHMKMVDIPHFKQVVLMSTVCDDCGYRSNDVKTGGEIPELGERITLKVTESRDLGRDILKSETCALESPSLTSPSTPAFFDGLDAAINGEKQFTIILTDPLASSYVQSLVEPPQPDPQITRENYTRTHEEEEDLGLNDIKVEGYENDVKVKGMKRPRLRRPRQRTSLRPRSR
ncbi:unnamed protein product [Parascedosporium putredinis]|uniref:Zinc finger ZPR1-type domain-containing protein n=1 Tax=Parascedosporium putredinis TaxID=1442378 RepID=A0A9P1M7J2_9PEZI|nr:unnamed protein product [Parascedosporium putredinis]CAI7990612.1 unnamed protein product [Parascedosporium putredinis]